MFYLTSTIRNYFCYTHYLQSVTPVIIFHMTFHFIRTIQSGLADGITRVNVKGSKIDDEKFAT